MLSQKNVSRKDMCFWFYIYIFQTIFIEGYERALCFVKIEVWHNFMFKTLYKTEKMATQFAIFFFSSCLFSFSSVEVIIFNQTF